VVPFSLEDFFLSSKDQATPGAQLYLYRLLHLLADGEKMGDNPSAISYRGSKKLAVQLGLDSADKLAGLFQDLGLGELQVKIDPDAIAVILQHKHAPASIPPGHESACELERGIIDGSLEQISGMQVTSYETSCWTRGDQQCTFKATMDKSGDIPRYVPGSSSMMDSLGQQSVNNRDGFGPGQLRSWYMDLAARELARSRRHSRPLSFVYMDLDDLGRVNAEHGRQAGDQVINAVSAALSRSCRAEDYLWHNGEDEFAIVLAETDADTADIVAQRLSTAIYSAAENIDFAAKISASIGFSSFPEHADDLSSLLERARSALYLAKASGKGGAQVAVEDPRREHGKSAPQAARRATADAGQDQHGFAPRRSMTEMEDETAADSLDTESKPVSVIVAMSGPLMMAGIRQIIDGEENIEMLEEVSAPARLPDIIDDVRPEMVIADMAMAIEDDFAALRLIREENLPCKFLVFADVIDQEVIKTAADFKIDGIILQSATPKEIIAAIAATYKGQSVMPEEAKAAMKDLENKRQLLDELSDRELDVLKLIAEGKSNSQISEELFITVNTVRFHLANIYQKLSVSNRTEAANCYLKQDIDTDNQPRLL
jgi:diguanylate cyclase (GGDEF)-like protein